MQSRFKHFCVLATMICLLDTVPGWSQETRGTILGRVLDATGAIIPNAKVTVINKAMGTRVALKSNGEGYYVASYLIPGRYQVQVEAEGFKKFIRDNIELRIDDKLEINVPLELGGVDQSVTVSAEASLLATESASSGSVVDARRVADLPISYGNPFELIGLAGGVSFARDPRLDRPFEPTHIVGYTMDGTRANRSDVTLDGAPSTATANANEVIATYVPPTDLVAEFKVQTATFDAAFGQTEGGVTNIAIKSGTNQFHGTAYYSITRPSLWANDFFGNATKTPRPDFVFNRWGGTTGGPILIPKLYNGKNRTFFMFGYEGIHDSRPRNNGTPSVPTVDMKNGDFSALLAIPNTGPSYQIYNPFTRRSIGGGRYQQDPFPGNKIPSSMFNPVGKAILGFYSDPLSAGSADKTNNFQQSDLVEVARYYTYTVRGDHNISDKQRLFIRGSYYRRDSVYNDYFKNAATGTVFQFLSQSGVFDDVYTLNATTLLNVRYGYNRFIRAQDGPAAGVGFDIGTLGFPKSYNDSISAGQRRFPRIDFGPYQGTGFTGEYRPVDTHSINTTLSKTIGVHSMRAGMEFRAYRETDVFFSNDQTGRFNFDGSWTRGPLDNSPGAPSNVGQAVASLLLGLPTASNSYIARSASYAEQSTSWGIFFQDDWKVSRKLTLNLGLRWEKEGALTERYNRSVAGLDFGFVQPFSAAAQANYAKNPTPEVPVSQFVSRGGVTFAGVGGLGRGLYDTPNRNFMPRFGLAYQFSPKWVVRAGYGIFYGFLGERRGDVVQSGFSRQTPYIPSNDNGLTFLATLSNPFPTGVLEPVGAAQGPQTFVGQTITVFNQSPIMPRMQRWELSLQRELRGGFLAEAAYIGNKGIHIEINRNLNATPSQYLSNSLVRDQTRIDYLSANLPNPFVGLLPAGATSTFTGANISRERLLHPFPEFDAVNSTSYEGYSWYHSLQMRLEKRFTRSYTVGVNYTYSKFMQATELLNAGDPQPVRVISDSDYPHRLSASGIAQFPFGRGHRYLANSGRLVNSFVGGWQLSGIYVFQSGAPTGFGNILFYGNAADIRVASDQQSTAQWINTNAGFEKASARQLASNQRYFPLRFGTIRNDKTNNVDFALIKNTRVAEGKDIQFRAEALNAFNHPLLPAPNTTPTASTFGTITASTQANYPRRLQLTFKFLF